MKQSGRNAADRYVANDYAVDRYAKDGYVADSCAENGDAADGPRRSDSDGQCTTRSNTLLNEAVAYFKTTPGFDRLLNGFKSKYERLGRLGGTVVINEPTEEEKEALSSFMRRDFFSKSQVRITFDAWSAAWERTKFAELDFHCVMSAYFGAPLRSKQEIRKKYTATKSRFFDTILAQARHAIVREWWEFVVERGEGTRGIHRAYDRAQARKQGELEKSLIDVTVGLDQLLDRFHSAEGEYVRLPRFAASITGNPHDFDIHTEKGSVLLRGMQWIRQQLDDSYGYQTDLNAEEITDLLVYFKIIRDDILNFVTCCGILALDDHDQPIPVWKEACTHRHVLNVPLREMMKTAACLPFKAWENRHDYAQQHKVFVVENSGVFSDILDRFDHDVSMPDHFSGDEWSTHDSFGQAPLLPGLICTQGQFKLAAWMLFDRLVKQNVHLYYSGDFDLDGIRMAQRFKNRYPDHVHLWRYSVADYETCASGKVLDKKELNRWDRVDDTAWNELKQTVIKRGKTAFQEDLLDLLVADIREEMGNM